MPENPVGSRPDPAVRQRGGRVRTAAAFWLNIAAFGLALAAAVSLLSGDWRT
jgi:hypothetical protein